MTNNPTPAANVGVGTAAYPPTGNGGAIDKATANACKTHGIAPRTAAKLHSVGAETARS